MIQLHCALSRFTNLCRKWRHDFIAEEMIYLFSDLEGPAMVGSDVRGVVLKLTLQNGYKGVPHTKLFNK